MHECSCYRCVVEHCERKPLPPGEKILGIVDPRLNGYFLCETCGNKRCPHAADHRHACSGSNEPGQVGSRYEDAPTFQPDAGPSGGEAGWSLVRSRKRCLHPKGILMTPLSKEGPGVKLDLSEIERLEKLPVRRDVGKPRGYVEVSKADFAALLASARREEGMREALAALIPANLGEMPASIPDSTILPCDVTAGEIRRARAALNQEPSNG